MANKIILKKSTVAAKAPLATDLEVGELAVNTADAKLYTKHTDGTVKQLNATAIDEMPANVDLDTKTVTGVYSQSLTAEATTALHYPVALAGLLEVFSYASMIHQRYWVYNSNDVYYRAKYSTGAWTEWTKSANVDDTVSSSNSLATARTLTIGSTGKNFNGSANVSWSLAEIGAAASSHAHGNITNAGAVGSTANLPLITGTSGVVSAGAWGTSSAALGTSGPGTATTFARSDHVHAMPTAADVGAVAANTLITAGTATKITYDAKGLVTAGVSLAASDIPSLSWSKITSGTPTTIAGYGITDAYTKTDIDGLLQGLKAKQSVRVATTANITLSGTQTIDGVAVVAGDRVLVKNQTTGSQNGIYVVAAGAWSRATDANAAAELTSAFVFVEQGTTNKDSAWVQTADSITLDTTALTWVQFSGSGAYAPVSHTHNYAGSSSAGGGANSVANSLVIKFDTGTTEGTDLYTFNGSAGKTIDIKAGSNITLTEVEGAITIAATNTTYSAATSSALGLIELGSDTQQTVAANAVTATTGRTYALQVNAAGQGVINVPWTNTTYTHPTTDGNLHVPATGTTNGGKVLQAGSTAGSLSWKALEMSDIPGAAFKKSVRVATTAALTATYANGTSGVGATLTNSGTLAALALDGVTLAVNDRVLVKNQATAAQNGIYTVTNIGSASVAWVLTRAVDADSSAEISCAVVAIDAGTANGSGLWTNTFRATDTLGTTVMNWYEVMYNSGTWAINTTGSAAKLTTPRALTIGSTAKNFDGSAAVTWSLAEIGAAASSHTHGNITDAGAVGSTANLPLITGTSGVVSAGAWGTSSAALGTSGPGTATTFARSDHVHAMPTAADVGAAASTHTHNYAGSASAGGAANSVANSLVLKFGSGTTEGTDQYTFNGTAGKTVDIKAGSNVTLTETSGTVTIAATNTTYSAATSTALGLIELASDTQQTVAANAVSTTTNRTYGLQVNANGQGVINVPWTDTVYTHPTTDGSLHVPATGTTNAGRVLQAGSTAGSLSWKALDMTDIPSAALKKSVRVATTANITLSGTQTIDGVAVVAGDRVLVKNQTTGSQNGIYVVAAGAWSRAAASDSASEIAGAVVNVDSGTANGGLVFTTNFKSTDTINTTAMNWYSVVDSSLLATAGNSIVGAIKYNSTTKTSGQFYGGTTAPSNTTRLNYDGNLYATNFYGNGSTLSNVLPLSGGTLTGGLSITTTGNAGIELGRVDGTASTPFIDFHSGATAIDYDARIIASGGTGTAGKGALTVTADGGITFTGTVTAPALVVGGSYISPGRLFFYSNM